MALDIVAWHDRTSADHQTQWNHARAGGYSTSSICVYGDRSSPLYAAAMVRRPTQTQEQMFIGMSASDWQAKFNSMAAQGWGPEMVTATGPANDPLFAACFIHSGSIPLTRHGMTATDFNTLNQQQMTAGNILRWADVYGNPGDLRYTGIWVANPENRAWNCDGIDDAAAVMQARFNALVTGGARPVHIATTPDLGSLILYDDSAQQNWQLWNGMTSAGYQTKFNTLYPQGLRPIRVSANGTGSNARFGVIFSVQEDSDAPTFRVHGPSGSAAVPAIDAAMEAMMTANLLHGASVAVVMGTRLVYARGYTFGSSKYPDVQPTTFFRQASVSKTFTAAAIYQLIDQKAELPGGGTFTLDTHLHDVLPGIANGPAVTGWNDITIRHLLEMTSGVTSSVMGEDLSVAPVVGGVSILPVSPLELGQWLFRQNLFNTPGDKTKAIYSNAGYMLLGLVLAQLRGAGSFVAGLNSLLSSLHITRVRSAVSAGASQAADEARYHPRPLVTVPSVMATGQPMCMFGYGENNLENCGGGGGLSAAATDVARLVAALSVAKNNPMMSVATLQNWMANAANATATLTGPFPNEVHGFHGFDSVATLDATNHIFSGEKGGLLNTSQNGFQFVTGGVSTVLCWNGLTPAAKPVWFPIYQDLLNAINAQNWRTTDLFPAFGMPVFQVVKPPPIYIPRPVARETPSYMVPGKTPVKNM